MSSTISKDVARGNTAREEDILSAMGDKAEAERLHSKRTDPYLSPIPSPAPPGPNFGFGRPPNHFGFFGPADSDNPSKQPSLSSSGSQEVQRMFLPRDWKPTWLSSLHDADQNVAVNRNFNLEAGGGSSLNMVNLVNGVGVCEQTPRTPVQAQSINSQENRTWSSNSQMENQNTASPTYVDQLESNSGAYTLPENLPTAAHILAQIANKTIGLDLHGNSKQARFFSYALDVIEKVDTINSILWQRLEGYKQEIRTTDPIRDEPPNSPAKEGPYAQVLHRIYCHDASHNHDKVIYEDEPRVDADEPQEHRGSSSRKLHADKCVRDLDSYLDSNSGICLIIFKEYVCQRMPAPVTVSPISTDFVSLRKERLRIVSQVLKAKFTEVATCVPDSNDFLGFDGDMDAPYHFLYHHRKQIAKLLESDDEETRKHAALLHDFLDHNYKEEYSEADEQFKAGVVNKKNLSKLFKPNQVIILTKNNVTTAHVVSSWPSRGRDREAALQISYWSWEFDGQKLNRTNEKQSSRFGIEESVPITQLEFFPSEYASKAIIQGLTERGQKFWSLRQRYFASYSGWDIHRDEHYVSYFQRMPQRKENAKSMQVNGRFMIDMSTYRKIHKKRDDNGNNFMALPIVKDKYDRWPIVLHITQTIDDTNLMLLPPEIPGFEMQTKRWGMLTLGFSQYAEIGDTNTF